MIKARKKTKDPFYEIQRKNEIYQVLSSCFEKEAIDEKDDEIILNWACDGINKERLVYLLEKRKQGVFK